MASLRAMTTPVAIILTVLHRSAAQELYTSNSICRPNYCTNPIFPGLNDLTRLELLTWQCPNTDRSTYLSSMQFCGNAVLYPPALPSPNASATAMNVLVKAQDDAAATMFFYHLNALGYESWEHQTPWSDKDNCIKDTWRMVCYTYFPKAEAGCQAGQGTKYLRPCKDPCQNYLNSCQVECCDESPSCVFSHTLTVASGQALVQTGYVDAVAPNAQCTGLMGSGTRGLSTPLVLIFALFGLQYALNTEDVQPRQAVKKTVASSLRWQQLVVAVAMIAISISLTGCAMNIPSHNVGNWRGTTDYLVKYEFVAPGKTLAQATLNSCSGAVAAQLQCSGRGFCKAWNPNAAAFVYSPTGEMQPSKALSFCQCDTSYTDPECRTKRKSQSMAFFMSLFGGIFGLDYFYLGLPITGVCKLCTLGGLGFWWLVDLIRMGSGPVYAHDFRVAADLPHWLFVSTVAFIFIVFGFFWALTSYQVNKGSKRAAMMDLQRAEENRNITSQDELNALGPGYYKPDPQQNFNARRSFSGYGATLPVSIPNAGAPYAHPPAPGQPGPFAGPYGPAGVAGKLVGQY